VPSRFRAAANTSLLATQLVATLSLAGVAWTVQLAVYPQMALIGEERFLAWHAAYTGGIALVVGPLMAVEALGAAALVWLPPPRVPSLGPRLGLALVGVVLASTALIQAPLHGRLAGGFSPEVLGLLVLSHWLRTGIWSLRAALVTWMAVRGLGTPPHVGPGPGAGQEAAK
jgi:hypothetical protein